MEIGIDSFAAASLTDESGPGISSVDSIAQLLERIELFSEKLDLLLQIRKNEFVTWQGKFRPVLKNQPVYPRPLQDPLPVDG